MTGKLAIKASVQGGLIYGAMAAYLAAFATLLVSALVTLLASRMEKTDQAGGNPMRAIGLVFRKIGLGLYFVGFIVVVAAFVYRWIDVRHTPLQNLFEVFLCLGMLIFLMSVFCGRFMGVGGYAWDAFVGFVVLFPAGFVFSAEPQKLPPALQSWLFAPHVAAYMLAYAALAKATVQAVGQLVGVNPVGERMVDYETATYRMVRLGFPLLTLGLILGAWWGKIAWGDYWNWDPKELWSLVSWLFFVGYLHVRYLFGRRRKTLNSAIVVGGFLAIVITLLWVNLSKVFGGLHSYAS